MNDFVQAGWMLVVLACAVLAYRRVGRDAAHERRVQKLEESFSEWPAAQELLARLDEMEESIGELESTTGVKPLVDRCNALTKDMLEMKTLLAEHRETIAALRTRQSLGLLAER